MSKLLDRLDRITRGASRTLGFATASHPEPTSSLALLALLGNPDKEVVASATGAHIDAFVLPRGIMGVDDLDGQIKPLEGATWGVVMGHPERDRVEAYQEKGCDFLIFDIADTRVDVLEEGECGHVLRIPADLEEPLLRGLEDLPVDIILLRKPAPEGPLCLVHLLAISNVRSATSRYLLLEWNGELTSRELEHLRDMGVDGLVLHTEEAAPSVIVTLQERINALPPRKARGEQRPVAILPRTRGPGTTRPQRQEEEEEEEEEWEDP